MALTDVGPPWTLLEAVTQTYPIVLEDELGACLERHPDGPSLLAAMRPAMRDSFADDAVKLEVFTDPEWPPDQPELVVNIRTRFPSAGALVRLKRIDSEWWLDRLHRRNARVQAQDELRIGAPNFADRGASPLLAKAGGLRQPGLCYRE